MNMMIYILAAAILGAAIGFMGAAVLASQKLQRLEKDTWAAANRYYQLRHGKQ